ncbi:PAS domain S-box-containing protein [Catenibacillus scindens]|uniref:HTH-type transcriptional regulatory protein TyrR n=1 Tax=Catenibacillus scindens TaxID=673271 RepID=A0A7W8HAT1_9FIRM|nr:sigma 54-interacting transcriptional regulator [Catenibacillus scindens]MBB5264282.1 PAS domain S-box-containing protein [Catenibacillus scindens]
MNQYLAICNIRNLLKEAITLSKDEKVSGKLETIDKELSYFLQKDIDFKEVVDGVDDSIFITDAKGNVLYVNPAYTKNTGIEPEEVLGHNISQLTGRNKLYTGGAVADVIKTGKSAFRLSTTYKTSPPQTGYVVGTPIFDDQGNLRQVVAISRTIVSLKALKDDFQTFIKEIHALASKPIDKNSNESLSGDMIGKHTSLANIWTIINHIAPSDATVLITGESGVGKEVIADEIFKNSKRNKKPFIKINCASIPANLLESELFGYEKGAFSGASAKGKPGLFELANHGTLLLDEIGDMPMDLQVKLLRAIQNQEITRIGGTAPVKLDIRFLALTNSNLKEKIKEGTFRQDLYYRLNVIPIYVPPLRERIVDLEELCNFFINKFIAKYDCPFHLTAKQMDYMKKYEWPGNIRELENIMEYLVLCSAGTGQVDDSILTGLLNISYPKESAENNISPDMDFTSAVAAFEKELLEKTLKNSRSLRDAGQKLGINASTISRKIRQYNIDYPHQNHHD